MKHTARDRKNGSIRYKAKSNHQIGSGSARHQLRIAAKDMNKLEEYAGMGFSDKIGTI